MSKWKRNLEDAQHANPPEDHEENTSDPGPDAGNHSGNEGDSASKQSGRGYDEVRGEMNRKFNQLNERLDRMFDQKAKPPAPQTSNAGGSDPLADASIEQLNNLMSKTEDPKEQLYLSRYIQKRDTMQMFDTEFTKFSRTQTARQMEKESAEKALDRFPQLHDSDSKFSRAVEKEMAKLGPAADEPGALLAIANEVGYRMDIYPNKRDVPVGSSRVSGGRSTRPKSAGGKDEGISNSKFNEISHRLRHAFKDGKMSDSQAKRVRSKSKEYDKQRNDPNSSFIKN